MGRRAFIFPILILSHAIAAAQVVVINEIMYTPLSPEPEWIELYNSGARSARLSGWSVEDASGGIAVVPETDPEIVLGAGEYLVLTRDTLRFRRVRPMPGQAVQLPLPTLNNGGDLIVLRNASGRLIDSVRWGSSWGGTAGSSLERRLADMKSAVHTTWGSSVSPSRATAGALNSITPVDRDLALDRLAFDPRTGELAVDARNNGLLPVGPARMSMAHDADRDGIIRPDEVLAEREVPALAPGDSVTIRMTWPRPVTEEGEEGLVEALADGDERGENDRLSFEVTSVPPTGGVIVTEIMYDPVAIGGRTGAEYVELYNPSRRAIRVADWRLYDATGTSQGVVRQEGSVAPLGYLLLATDSAIYLRFPWLRDSANVLITGPSSYALNIDGDEVVIRSPIGETVDSVPYLDAWHRRDLATTKGISLERISITGRSTDPDNWSSSVARAGGTPAAPNSLAIPPTASGATLHVEPHTVSPDADGYEDFTRISFRLPVPVGRLVVDVYDRQGRPVRRLASNELAGVDGELVWDGRADDGRPLEPGLYVVHLEAYDDRGGGVVRTNGTVIVARRLGK